MSNINAIKFSYVRRKALRAEYEGRRTQSTFSMFGQSPRDGSYWSDVEKEMLINKIEQMPVITPANICDLAEFHGRNPCAIDSMAERIMGNGYLSRIKL